MVPGGGLGEAQLLDSTAERCKCSMLLLLAQILPRNQGRHTFALYFAV